MDFLPLVLFGPSVDIVLWVVLLHVVAYAAYAWLYKKDFQKIASMSLRFSLIEILLVTANYAGSGTVVVIGGVGLAWYWYYMVVSIPLEIAFFTAYKIYAQATWLEVFGLRLKDEVKKH